MADEQLIRAAKRYQRAVANLFKIDPETKKCYAEGSPTKSQEVYERFVELNNAGQSLTTALDEAQATAN